MREATIIILATGWLSSLLFSRYVVRTYINPLLMFTSMWLVVITFYYIRLLHYYPTIEKTNWTILISYSTFTIGLMVPFLFIKTYKRTKVNFEDGFPHRRFNFFLYMFYFIGIIGFYLLYLEITKHFKLNQLFDPFYYRLLRQMFLDDEIGSRLVDYLTISSQVALVFSIFYAVTFKRRYLRIFLFLLPVVAGSFLSTGRSQFFSYFFFVFGSYVFIKHYLKDEPIKKYVLFVFPALLVISFAGIGILLLKAIKFTRYIDPEDIVESQLYMIYFYLTSPIAALNRLLMEYPDSLEWGRNIFAPVLRLVRYLYRDIEAPPVFQEFVKTPFRSNVYTYIRIAYKDFGFIGLATVPLIMGAIISTIWARLSHFKDITFLPLACHFTFVIFMTTFDDIFFRTTPILIFLYSVLFIHASGIRGIVRRVRLSQKQITIGT